MNSLPHPLIMIICDIPSIYCNEDKGSLPTAPEKMIKFCILHYFTNVGSQATATVGSDTSVLF